MSWPYDEEADGRAREASDDEREREAHEDAARERMDDHAPATAPMRVELRAVPATRTGLVEHGMRELSPIEIPRGVPTRAAAAAVAMALCLDEMAKAVFDDPGALLASDRIATEHRRVLHDAGFTLGIRRRDDGVVAWTVELMR